MRQDERDAINLLSLLIAVAPNGADGYSIVGQLGITWPRFAKAKSFMIRNLFEPGAPGAGLTYCYDASTHEYSVGSASIGTSPAQARRFLRWTGGYTFTRASGIEVMIDSYARAFPGTRGIRKTQHYAHNLVFEADALTANL